jgi:hypothetical protein
VAGPKASHSHSRLGQPSRQVEGTLDLELDVVHQNPHSATH